MCVRACVRACVCVCVCERERERERLLVCVCVCVCVCLLVRLFRDACVLPRNRSINISLNNLVKYVIFLCILHDVQNGLKVEANILWVVRILQSRSVLCVVNN